MIKKSKKFLALGLSLAALVSSVGNFSAFAADGEEEVCKQVVENKQKEDHDNPCCRSLYLYAQRRSMDEKDLKTKTFELLTGAGLRTRKGLKCDFRIISLDELLDKLIKRVSQRGYSEVEDGVYLDIAYLSHFIDHLSSKSINQYDCDFIIDVLISINCVLTEKEARDLISLYSPSQN